MGGRVNVVPPANDADGTAVVQYSSSMANRGASSAAQNGAPPTAYQSPPQDNRTAQDRSKPYWYDGVIREFARAVSSTTPGRDA